MKTAEPNTSISHGTLRTADLLSAFIGELENLTLLNGDWLAMPENHNVRNLLSGLIGQAQDMFAEDGESIEEGKEEQADWLLESLYEALDSFAPEGFYFGAHPGDGSDFGFWPIESEEPANT